MKKAIFEVLRGGLFKSGTTQVREDEIKSIAQFYDKDLRSANAVIGHPDNDEPKLGEVSKLYNINNRLFAEIEINDDLLGKIKNGEISGISCAFFRKENEQNPIKGIGAYLKHIGFLLKGKDEPAIKEMLDPRVSVINLNDEINIKILDNPQDATDKAEFLQSVANITYKQAFNLIHK
ncbi:hypothetical protein ACLSZY_03215 [Avibacterium volantium]|uniref:hypothetical protein n=1 Tax=Avibacterium TaxID=292486 RepID=UPI0039FD43E9